jgi:hypothetical protein
MNQSGVEKMFYLKLRDLPGRQDILLSKDNQWT